jgi:hypothetical protein
VSAGTQSQSLQTTGSRITKARSGAAVIESFLGSLVEISAGALVVAEIAILFGGVISRYLFDRPWSGRTSWPRPCSCGWQCSARSSHFAATSTCE